MEIERRSIQDFENKLRRAMRDLKRYSIGTPKRIIVQTLIDNLIDAIDALKKEAESKSKSA